MAHSKEPESLKADVQFLARRAVGLSDRLDKSGRAAASQAWEDVLFYMDKTLAVWDIKPYARKVHQDHSFGRRKAPRPILIRGQRQRTNTMKKQATLDIYQSGNGRVLAASSEGFSGRAGAKRNFKRAKVAIAELE